MANLTFIIACISLLCTFLAPHITFAAPLTPVRVNVGVILDLTSVAGKMSLASIHLALSDFAPENTTGIRANLILHVRDSKGDVATATAAALDLLSTVKVHLIIGPQNSYEAPYIAALATAAQIPTFSFSTSGTSVFPSRFPFFVKTAPSDVTQSRAIAHLMSTIRAKGVVLIYEDSHEYTELINSIEKEIRDRKISRVPVSPTIGDGQIYGNLASLMEKRGHIFLVHMPIYLASRLFDTAKTIGLLSDEYVWITTEFITSYLEATVDSSLFGFMHGVLGVKAHITPSKKVKQFEKRWMSEFGKENVDHDTLRPTAYEMWAYDTVRAVTIAVNQAIEENCFGEGENLLKLIRNTKFEGITGWFSIGKDGLNASKVYEIVAVGEEDRRFGVWTDEKGITWRRSLRSLLTAPVTGNLRIVIPGSIDDGFSSIMHVERINGTNNYRVTGFVKDVFDAAIEKLPYSLDYEFVPFVDAQGHRLGDYNELVRQVSLKQYDAAIGDITITANRSSLVDFTQPYLYSSVSMLVPLVGKSRSNMWSFLRPWKWDLWILVVAYCLVTGFVLWRLEQKSNILKRKCNQSDNSLKNKFQIQNIMDILYYSFYLPVSGANSDDNDPGLTRDTSKAVLTVWSFVFFTLSSSYTANLTTIFTSEQLKPSVTTIEELIKNQDYVGYLQSSYVKGMLLNMGFRESHLRPLASFEQYADALTKGSKNGGVAAIVDELPYLNLFVQYYCCNYTIPSQFNSMAGGFGFAFPKGSVLAQDMSTAILNLTESGRLAYIQTTWLGYYTSEDTSSTESLGSRNFWGLFGITGFVTLAALLISIVDPNKLPWKSSAHRQNNGLPSRPTQELTDFQ